MKIKELINSSKAIIISLILLVVVLLMQSYHVMRNTKTYMFSGENEYVRILNGVISLNYDVNLFQGSDIKYIHKDDQELISYDIGYYIKVNDKLKPFIIKSGKVSEGFSLKKIIDEMSAYNLTEGYSDKEHFTNEIKKNIADELYFIIKGETLNNEKINEKFQLINYKVSK